MFLLFLTFKNKVVLRQCKYIILSRDELPNDMQFCFIFCFSVLPMAQRTLTHIMRKGYELCLSVCYFTDLLLVTRGWSAGFSAMFLV